MSTPHTPESAPPDVAATFCATLIDEWIHHGVRHAVIAPGSRSTPMAIALCERSELTVQVVHDERAASFVALGIGLQGTPAILLCTSGTAATHFHAAIVEAHLSCVPMLVCTADRPPELRDVGAPQTIDQIKLYGDAVRWFHDPGVADDAVSHSWRSLAAHCFSSATGLRPGPVHLNLPFREPLLGRSGTLPQRAAVPDRPVSMHSSPTLDRSDVGWLASLLRRPRGLFVAGHGCGNRAAVAQLAQACGWPVLADARAGSLGGACTTVRAADQLLRVPGFARDHLPDVIVRLGEPPASKILNQWLNGCPATQVHVALHQSWSDPDGAVTHRVVAEPGELCRSLAALVNNEPNGWAEEWRAGEALAQSAFDAVLGSDSASELSEPLVARRIATLLPEGAHLVLSSSMPIRDVEWFGLVHPGVSVHSNRGANGIDGVVSTAIGVAVSTRQPTAVLIGDVAFLHDSSALVNLAARACDLRIVLIDNDGGGIFNFLPQAASLAPEQFELLFGTPHGTDLVALAAAHGLRARWVSTLAELGSALAEPGPSVTCVRTDRTANVTLHQRITDAVVAAVSP